MSANKRDDERAEIARRLDEVTEPLTLPPGVEITLIEPGAASWSNPTSSPLDYIRETIQPRSAHTGPMVVGPSQAANMARAEACLRGGDHGRTDPIADLRAAVEKLPRHQTFRFGSPIPPHFRDPSAPAVPRKPVAPAWAVDCINELDRLSDETAADKKPGP